MEAAGTIVGVIGLGLAICDGVIEYCRAWKHQQEEVNNLQDLTDSLKGLLENVDTQLRRNPSIHSSVVERLETTVIDCNKQIKSLLHLSQRYSPGHNSSKGSKFKDFLTRLRYPLEKKALAELRDLMTAFRANVELALSLLAIDVATSGMEETQAHRRDSDHQHTAICEKIENAQFQTVDSVVAQMDNKFLLFGETVVGDLASQIDESSLRLEETMLQSSAMISTQVERSSSMLHQIHLDTRQEQRFGFKDINNRLGEIQHLLAPGNVPLVKSVARRGKSRRHHGYDSSVKFKRGLCTCNVQQVTRFHHISGSWLEKAHEIEIVHDRSCPRWFRSKTSMSYMLDIVLFQRYRISGSIQVTKPAYSPILGFNIAPSLRFKTLVPASAPAFCILEEYFKKQQPDFSQDWADNCLQELHSVFFNGKGSPDDCITSGANLIDMAFIYLKLDKGRDSTSKLAKFKQLIDGLIELGVDFTSREQLGFGAQGSLHQLGGIIHGGIEHSLTNVSLGSSPLASKGALNLLAWLSKRGYELSTFPTGVQSKIPTTKANYPFGTALDAVRLDEDFAIDVGCGKLSMAVIRHQLDIMEDLLKREPNAITTESKLNIFGYNPLHMALSWPEGLELLLEFADDSTLYKTYPTDTGTGLTLDSILDYAISNGCEKSTRLLAKAGISFHFEWSRLVGTKALQPAVSDAIAELTSARLRGLYQFTDSLPPDVHESLGIKGFDSFDSKAKVFIEYCLSHDIQLPKIYYAYGEGAERELFCPPHGSVYHQNWLEPDAAQSYYDTGLREVDTEFRQLTPLMILKMPCLPEDHQYFAPKFFSLVHFFVRHGAQLERPIPLRYIHDPECDGDERSLRDRPFRAFHRIASLTWANVSALPDENVQLLANCGSSEFWVQLLGRTDRDSCVCACSIDGCRVITLACKSIARMSRWASESWVTWPDIFDPLNWERAVHFLSTIGALLAPLEKAGIEKDVIRFLTFSALDMTHTCCVHEEQHSFDITDKDPKERQPLIRLMDQANREEIRDEEELMIEQLDELVDQFMEDLTTSNISFSLYLQEEWQKTMFTVLSDEKRLSVDDVRKLSDVGVNVTSGMEDNG